MAGVIDELGDDAGELCDILRPWGDAIRSAGGYPGNPGVLLRGRRE
jgi:hypothetical protein